MKKIFVIFVNFNSGVQLREGLISVLNSKSVEGVVIIDNNSADNSLKLIDNIKTKKKLVVLKNKNNSGFYAALNKAIRKAFILGANNVMPLDFDLDFNFDFITQLCKADADMVAPTLKSKIDKSWFYDYGGTFGKLTALQKHILVPRVLKKGVVYLGSKRKNDKIDFISGGCTIVSKQIFESIGPYDEDYFVYWGDADYSIKAAQAGFKVAMDGTTIVHHKLENTSQTRNFNKLIISFFDNLTFVRKNIKWYFKPIAYCSIVFLSIKTSFKVLKYSV